MANKPRIRFRGFTEDWEQRNLGNLAEIVRGASPRPISDSKWFDNNSDVGWLRISDVTAQDGRIQYLEQKISKLGQDKTRVVKTPHLLLSIAATVGKPVINYVPTGVHDGFLIFLNPKFNILYAFWWLEMFREEWNKYGQPGSQVNLNSDLVKNQVINIPNEKEQEKISSFLEALDRIITLHQCKLKKLNLAKKSLLQKLFPRNGSQIPGVRFKGFTDAWEQRKLGDIATFSKGNGYSKSDLSASGNPIILYGRLYTNYETTIRNVDTFVELKDKSVISQGGEVIVPASGETAEDISRASVVKNQGVIIGGDLNVIKVNSLLDPTFLALTISNGEQQKELSKRAQGKSVVHLHNSDLQEVNLIFPLLNEQKEISTIFEKMDNIITLHQRKLERLQEVKKGLLQKMFV